MAAAAMAVALGTIFLSCGLASMLGHVSCCKLNSSSPLRYILLLVLFPALLRCRDWP